jgi:hypothetical protein
MERDVCAPRFACGLPDSLDLIAVFGMKRTDPAKGAIVFPCLSRKPRPGGLDGRILAGGVCSPGNIGNHGNQRTIPIGAFAHGKFGTFAGIDILDDVHGADHLACLIAQWSSANASPNLGTGIRCVCHFDSGADGLAPQCARPGPVMRRNRLSSKVVGLPPGGCPGIL